MCGYQFIFTVFDRSICLVAEIASLVTSVRNTAFTRDIRLRTENRVRAIQSSLQIEVNSLVMVDSERRIG